MKAGGGVSCGGTGLAKSRRCMRSCPVDGNSVAKNPARRGMAGKNAVGAGCTSVGKWEVCQSGERATTAEEGR